MELSSRRDGRLAHAGEKLDPTPPFLRCDTTTTNERCGKGRTKKNVHGLTRKDDKIARTLSRKQTHAICL